MGKKFACVMFRSLIFSVFALACVHSRGIFDAQMALDGGEDQPTLIIGTRGSPLALAQANETQRRLIEHFPELARPGAIEIRVIKTTGDARLDIPLSDIGGKGLFTKELDVALMNDEVDLCVHSMKDVPTKLVPGTDLTAILPRENPSDVLLVREGVRPSSIQDLPKGSVVGTASMRRAAQVLRLNPDVKIVNLRGNVQTRMGKLRDGSIDATLLAEAGLNRLAMNDVLSKQGVPVSFEDMLPAVAQGAIGIQTKNSNRRAIRYIKALNHPETKLAVIAERAFLEGLDGSCKTPIAGHAWIDQKDGKMHFKGTVLSCDGKEGFDVVMHGEPHEAEEIGREAASMVRKEAGEEFLEKVKNSLSPANNPGGWDMGPTA
eukprot:GDKJ01015462.1.p1 GENE.GDKJ01015462.1~~GDKJ01015462.1.p1  ORF type:complete len:376 (+),score=108.28 GDKJ01015462.1:1-1128(+)